MHKSLNTGYSISGIRPSNRSKTTSAILIFLHLPKTAGTTLAHILERQYGKAALLRAYDSVSGEELAAIPDSRLEHVRVIMGHFHFGAHRFVSKPSRYITVLRDPIERVISHYYFVRNSPSHYLYETSRTLSLGEFVVTRGGEEPNNDQTRLLAGECEPVAADARGRQLLALAQLHLRDDFAMTGLTEDFDRSLLLMKRAFGWRSAPFYTRDNVTRQRPTRERVPEETLRLIAAYNQLDLELYDYARALLEARIQLHGASLEKELHAFKHLNSVRGPLSRLTRSRFVSRPP